MQNSKISLCLTAIRSLRESCEESLQDEHEVITSFFFFSFLSIICILNAIALNFPAHVRWEAVHLPCCAAQLNNFSTVAEICRILHICKHFSDVYIVCVGQCAVCSLYVLLLKVLVAVVHSLLDLHIV